jgi:predicted Zn-dependent peptidase
MTPIQTDRKTAPAAKPFRSIPLPAFQHYSLSNGMPVYLLPFGMVDVLEVSAVFRGGFAFGPKAGAAMFTANNLMEGTKTYDSLALAQRLDHFGSWIHTEVEQEFISVNLTTLTRHLHPVLPLLREVVLEPQFPEAEFLKMKQRNLEKVAVEEKKTAWMARRQFNHSLFGKQHPYGRHIGQEEIQEIEVPDLRSYHSRYFVPSNCSLFVAGSFSPETVLALLEKEFGQVKRGPHSGENSLADAVVPENRSGRKHIAMEGMQSTIRLGQLMFERAHPDYYKMQVVSTILGGYFGSRLMKNIREDKGYTYGIYSGIHAHRKGGYFFVQGDVGNEYVEPAIEETKKEMNLLIRKGVGEDEMDLVRNYMLGKSLSQRETAFQLAEAMRFSVMNGIPFSELDRKFEVIQEMKAAEVAPLAETYLQPDKMLEVVAGGTSTMT